MLLTTITTMAGLAPMMFGVSLDFVNGGYSIDSPTALWWKQLATAVVFCLGVATVLTLVVTPSLLAIRVWFWTYVVALLRLLARVTGGRGSQIARDMELAKKARRLPSTEVDWTAPDWPSSTKPPAQKGTTEPPRIGPKPLEAAE